MENNIEQWKTTVGFPKYECSDKGNFRTKSTKRLLRQRTINGYLKITLTNSENKRIGKNAHILIAKTWIENPENKPTVDHKNKKRNDNRVCNLRWATYKEQAQNIDYTKRKVNHGRPVWKCDKDTGERIQLYNSVTEAAKSINEKASNSRII